MARFSNPSFDSSRTRNPRLRNPRFAPEFLERRLSPSSVAVSLAPVAAYVSMVDGPCPTPSSPDGVGGLPPIELPPPPPSGPGEPA